MIDPLDEDSRFIVLAAVAKLCTLTYEDGSTNSPVDGLQDARLVKIEGLRHNEVAQCCKILEEEGLIRGNTMHDDAGAFYFANGMTVAGYRYFRNEEQARSKKSRPKRSKKTGSIEQKKKAGNPSAE